jgi:hypothetical protein
LRAHIDTCAYFRSLRSTCTSGSLATLRFGRAQEIATAGVLAQASAVKLPLELEPYGVRVLERVG